jgi:hypothetical protein
MIRARMAKVAVAAAVIIEAVMPRDYPDAPQQLNDLSVR